MSLSEQNKTLSQWTFWFKWVIVSAISNVMGPLVGGYLAHNFFPTDDIRFTIVLGLIGGLIVGFAQWLLLRQLINGVGWWILATSIAWTIGVPLGTMVVTKGERMIPHLFAAILGSLVIGTIVGFLQWLVLRKNFESRSIIWIAATIISSFVGTFVRQIPKEPILEILASSIVGGAITGYALVWLMQTHQQEVPNENV